MLDEFRLGRVPGLGDDKLKGLQVFGVEPLQFADEHIPRMHEAEGVAVAFNFQRPCPPVQCAFESVGIADLNIKIRLSLGPTVVADKFFEQFPVLFRRIHINVFAQKSWINEQLQRSLTEDRDVEFGQRWQGLRQRIKLFAGVRDPIDFVFL